MIEVRPTAVFAKWLRNLGDRRAQERIAQRLAKLQVGLFGDVKYFSGIGELRVDYGPGYRIYFVKKGDIVVILLCGGDKRSQNSDIRRAVAMAKET